MALAPYIIANYVLGTLFALLGVVATVLLIFTLYKDHRALKLKTAHVLFLEVAIICFLRMTYFYLPAKEYITIMEQENGVAIQMMLDLLPEILFLLIYLLLVASWVEILIRVRTVSTMFTTKKFWILYAVSSLVISMIASILIIVTAATGKLLLCDLFICR